MAGAWEDAARARAVRRESDPKVPRPRALRCSDPTASADPTGVPLASYFGFSLRADFSASTRSVRQAQFSLAPPCLILKAVM